jgi:hypothetical protein
MFNPFYADPQDANIDPRNNPLSHKLSLKKVLERSLTDTNLFIPGLFDDDVSSLDNVELQDDELIMNLKGYVSGRDLI